MKLVKMSLAAALLMGASAFALENTKVSGDASLFYGTNDMDVAGSSGSLFDKDNSYADAGFNLGVTTDVAKGISAGAKLSVLTTLGLEHNLVSGVWNGAHSAAADGSTFGADVKDAYWMSEAWIAASLDKTTVKLGRMELDTPLLFSETWNLAANSFEAAVLINTDLPDTTVVGAWVGKTNDGAAVVATDGKFRTFAVDGAFALAVVNNSYKPLTVQGWYYDVTRFAQAYWLQADYAMADLGLDLGAQYTAADVEGVTGVTLDAYALKAGYTMDALTASVAYSQTNADGAVAGNPAASGQSKLYTEAWWNYAYVTRADTQTINVSATYAMKDVADFGLYFTQADQATVAGDGDLQEITVTASLPVGAVNATLAYINTDAKDQNLDANLKGQAYNTVQVYLTAKF